MYRYDEKQLLRRLHALNSLQRLIFAAGCASRLFSLYLSFHKFTGLGDPSNLRAALDGVWDWIKGQKHERSWYEQQLQLVMRLIPSQDEVWTDFHAGAEDSTSAVAYALRTLLTGDPEEAAWAARCSYELLDNYLVASRRINVNDPRVMTELMSDPLIQAELARQDRDLKELEVDSPDITDIKTIVERMRMRAEAEQVLGSHQP